MKSASIELLTTSHCSQTGFKTDEAWLTKFNERLAWLASEEVNELYE